MSVTFALMLLIPAGNANACATGVSFSVSCISMIAISRQGDLTMQTPQQDVSQPMLDLLQKLRKKVVIGFVGGSDLKKQQEQLGCMGTNGVLTRCLFDFLGKR